MPSAHFRFYEELNDFLPPSKRKVEFEQEFAGRPAVKDIIEALGVPHTEVDLILIDGKSVDFSTPLVDGAHVSVYPMFEALDITPLLRVRARPLRTSRFVLDAHLGRLARYLRLLGFDAWYRNDYDDRTLARICQSERRILLTRDRGLLKRSTVTHGYYVRETQPLRQAREVLGRFDLYRAARPFKRCLHCNGLIKEVTKEEILNRLEPNTHRYFDQFWVCESCQRIYWQGSHYERMQRLVQALLKNSTSERCSTN
ncbi:MAG TPA: Mut7-C RNAse domain-containing protein [Gammaproteobacteria bacterium]|nr:Mut7-C RNAse domain-containing protein [Gammaproteobacteria bacterium]